jgi:hypothetical protein
VLVGADKRGINHCVLIVGIPGQMFETPFPDAAFRPSAVAAVNILPIATPLRKVSPRNACAEAVHYRFHKQPVVCGRSANRPFPARKQRLDPIPLIIP